MAPPRPLRSASGPPKTAHVTLMKILLTTCILVAALLGTGVAAAAPAADDPPQRLVVHFDRMPPGLQPHGDYEGADVLAIDEALGFAVVQAPHGKAFKEHVHGRSGVRSIEADGVSHALGLTPTDPGFGKQYAPQAIGAPAAWSTSLGGPAATVCMLDTGVRYTHEDLKARYVGGTDLVNFDSDPWDDGGHGTRTAGVAVATINNGLGVAGIANAPLKEVKVLDSQGQGYDSDIAMGIRWCADNGARIVSMSVGGPTPSSAVQSAVDYAWGKGLLLVAAAGNGGCADCVLYPAAYSNVIAVGCIDQALATCSTTSKGLQVDLAAPGSNIYTTGHGANNAYLYGGGTSLSAPHVSGAAALVWNAHPTYTNVQVRQALEATAQDVGPAGRDTASGAGLVRADRALAYGSAPAPAPAAAFTATFAPASGSNAWWVDLKVTASATVASVSATVNGGSPHALAKTSWGTWAASFSAPKGSTVLATAKDVDGRTAMSPPMAWLVSTGTATSSPTPTSTTSTAPSPATFAATFTPKTLTNHWWVETAVSSGQAIAKVEVRLDGGAWTALPKDSWGTYAKSMSVPAGTHLVFRATSTTGATATSPAFTEA
ncbi:MAG TPA: S8 family serine peptidase [Candidatus Thermoplasmatota archaeon]|nr:S8 family serine peptidase [Candidatus Thermoplasmatota archaeon]